MTGAVDRVAGRTAEGVVETSQMEVVLPLVRAMAVDVVSVEVRHDTCGCRVDEVANAVVGHGDRRGHTVVVIFGARQITGVVVGVVGCDATRPNAAGELAVGGVGVGRALYLKQNHTTTPHTIN